MLSTYCVTALDNNRGCHRILWIKLEMAFPLDLRTTLIILIILVTSVTSALSSNSGREFIFAPLPNHPDHDTPVIGVVLQAVSRETTNVNISIPGRSVEEHSVSLSSRSGPYNYQLPVSLVSQDASGIISSTVAITSNQDIFVFSYSLVKATSGIFNVIPAHNLGQEYFIASECNRASCVIIISALHHSVAIKIYLNSTVQFENNWFYAGDILRCSLLPYQSVQLLPEYTNITGSRVLANNSIAVTAGAKCSNVPTDVKFCDHLAEQLLPLKSWGYFYTLSPFPERNSGYIFQVVAGRDDTTVFYRDNTVNMNMGEYVTFDVTSQDMTFVSADKPILIMQYVKGKESDDVLNSDPSMIQVPPNEQFVKDTTFPIYEFTGTASNIDTMYFEITAECQYMANISVWKEHLPISMTWIEEYSLEILDGTRICSRWSEVEGGKYSVRSQRVITDEGQAIYPRFRAVVYATGSGESYLYRAGSNIRQLTASHTRGAFTYPLRGPSGMVNPHILSIATTEISLGWNITQDGVGLFDRCTAYVNDSRSVQISTEPPAVLTGLHPYTKYFFHIICSNSLGVSSRMDFPVVPTLKTVPARPPVLSEAVDGVGQYSFKINVPHYNESNGPISCFEFIVVQLYNSSTNIDSEDGAFSIDSTGDYNISKNRAGTPFRAMVFSSLPANETITIGSLTELETECFMGDERNDDQRVRRGTVNASTLYAINGPLNPGGYYTCFLRVYSPTGQDEDFYYVNGPAMDPVKLKDADSEEEMTPTNASTLIPALPSIIISLIITIIFFLVHLKTQKI